MTAAPDDPDDALEEGLRAAFGLASGPHPTGARSVLARLAPDGLPRPGILLRDEGSAPDHVLTLRSGEAARTSEGRYQIAGELARGGVGVILKGRDVDLGRDVAMKVLRDEHARNPDVLQRFVEEAQIGGQLQHPGIVPVYEMGVRADQRPYFTMKLIKGRTLAALLSERLDPSQDRRRFLSVFESVCQTVAYAHARGVIHRDLKPANVMVGAFGEVLVVDWGMGKVLAKGGGVGERTAKRAGEPERTVVATVRSEGTGSHSEVGSVMGTPRYMPPEQARGDIDRLDERVDVFALGAILCEILTGQPPYTGTEQDAVVQAARGILEDAHSRLAASGSDGELVALAKSCLSPAAMARPKDAGAVANEVGAYLASVEERVKAAEVAAVQARVKATEERKRRRLSLALSAAVIGLVVLGGSGWFLIERGRRQRAEDVGRAVARTIEEAMLLRGKAAAGTDLAPWKEAVSATKRAVAIARSQDADEATREASARVLAEFEAEERAADARARRKAGDDAMVARLDDIRLDRSEHWEAAITEREYAEAFREYGIDPDRTDDLGALAASVRASPIAPALVIALEEWRSLGVRVRGSSERLAALVQAADPDPWRVRLRAAKTLQEHRDLARTVEVDRMPMESLVILVDRLGFAGDPEQAAALARLVQARHPGDFYTNFGAGYWSFESRPPRFEEAVRYYTAARALRPRSGVARANLGDALQGQGDIEGAIAQYREAIRLRPEDALAHNNLGTALFARRDLDAAMVECREAIRLRPTYAAPHVNVGNVLCDRGDVVGAIAEYREAIRLEPSDWHAHHNLGNQLLKTGDPDGAIASYREAIRLRPDDDGSHAALVAALREKGDLDGALAAAREVIRLLSGSSAGHSALSDLLRARGDLSGAVAEGREAVRLQPGDAVARGALGNALRARGDLDGAVAELREAVRLQPNPHYTHRNLGLALDEAGDPDGAIVEFRRAIEISPDDAVAHDGLGHALYTKGDLDGAIAACRKAIRLRPDSAIAHGHLGLALRDQRDLDGAVAEHREAVRLDPGNAGQHVNYGIVLAARGDHEGAIAEYRAAQRLDPTLPHVHNNLGNELRDQGDRRGALLEYREAARLGPREWSPHSNAGLALEDLGDLPGAIAEYREAIRLDPRRALSQDRLGVALTAARDLDGAIASLVEAIRLAPGAPEGHYHLSSALRRAGRFAEAVDEYRRAMEVGAKVPTWQASTAEGLRRIERYAELAPNLDDLVAGRIHPKDADEWQAYAKVAYYLGRHAASARFYREAFARNVALADDVAAAHRYDAACSAALASAGEGVDGAALDASARSRLRKEALAWLRADLGLVAQQVATGSRAMRATLDGWKSDHDLAGVRGEAEIARMPADEKEAWRALWLEVDALIAKSTEAK